MGVNLVLVVNPLGVVTSDGEEEVSEAVIGSSVVPEVVLVLMDDKVVVTTGAVDELPAVVETGPLPLLRSEELRVLVSVSGLPVTVLVTTVVLSAAELVNGVNG